MNDGNKEQATYDMLNFTISEMTECGRALRRMGEGAGSMEEAADRVVRHLYDGLIDSSTGMRACSLVRFFKTHSFSQLEDDLQGFARGMLGDMQASPGMKCLVLLATAGEKSEWNSRKKSTGHKIIPLPSEDIVHRIPMIRNLIKQLGLSAGTVIKPDSKIILDLQQRTYNVFYVPEAFNSPYIPAQQEFVIPCGIRSVLGFGGVFPSGNIFAIIMFTKVPVTKEVAGLFRTLSLNVKLAVLPFETMVFAAEYRKSSMTNGISNAEIVNRRSQKAALDQLLQVYEQTALEQTKKLFDEMTERRRKEEELRRMEHKYHHLFDNMTDAAFLADAESGVVLETNIQGEQLLGRTRDEIIGMNQGELHPPWKSEEYRRRFALHANKGHQADYDGEVIRKDGTIVPVSISATPSVLAGKKILLGLFRDITERKKVAEALKESEAQLRTVMDSINAGVMLVDPETHKIVDVNSSALELMGKSKELIIGSICHGFICPAEAGKCPITDLNQAVNMSENELINSRGEHVPILKSVAAVKLRGRMFLIESFVDITKRKLLEKVLKDREETLRNLNNELELKVEERTKQLLEAQEELVRKEKLSILGQLSGSVGHELRNPLGVINNAVYFLKTVMPDPDETVKEYLGIIKSEVDNSQRIITDLLDFSRTKTPLMKSLTVSELIRQSLGKCTVPGGLTVNIDLPETLPRIKVDPLQMSQVFQNLIMNAVQAMPDGGALRISAKTGTGDWGSGVSEKKPIPDPQTPTPEVVEISVTDTGTGIAPENMEKIFQPLFTTKAKGIGLGLVVCKRLTEANGGKIEVDSQEGTGTTFTVNLPAEGGHDLI